MKAPLSRRARSVRAHPSRRDIHVRCTLAAIGAVALVAMCAFGQSEEARHVAVVEIGGAADWGLTGGPVSLGGTVAVEATPVERWLELELGVTALGTNGRREVSTDLLVKKPFSLSPTVEFMVGVGPEWSWNLSGPQSTQSLAAEFVLDVMFWPTANLGWYVEPSYSTAGVHAMSDRSFGVTAGLLVGLPWAR